MADRPDDISEQTWSQLSDADREALADDPVDVAEEADPAATPPGAVPPSPPIEPPPGADAPPAPAPDQTTSTTDQPAANEPAGEAAAEPPAAPAAPPPAPAAPAMVDPLEPPQLHLPNYATDKAAAEAAMEAVMVRFSEGEIDTAEMIRLRDSESQKLAALERDKMRVEVRDDERKRYFNIQWSMTADAFMNTPANAELYKPGSDALREFNALVTDLAQAPRFANVSHAQFLAAIDRMVRPMFVTAAAPAAPAPATPAPAPAKGRAPNLAAVPPTLSGVPPADRTQNSDDPFAGMDKLTGEAYLEAIARLSPADRAKWERAA